jgi:hypothetical protein
MTTTVAITAQYASGNPTSRPSNIEIVAAIAVRKACDSVGRFSRFQVQNFINELSSLPIRIGKIAIDAAAVAFESSLTNTYSEERVTRYHGGFTRFSDALSRKREKVYLKIRPVHNWR